ncbi:MAG: hypothetical protein ACTH2Q_05035 [Propionibacteriaceae bacterium]
MEFPDLDGMMADMRAEAERLETEARETTQLRLKWERQRTTDPELIKKLDRALAGEITWLDVMTSREYQQANGAELDEAVKEYEERRQAGTLPGPEEAEAQLGEFMTTMREDVAAAEQAEAEAEQAAEERERRAVDSPFVPPIEGSVAPIPGALTADT